MPVFFSFLDDAPNYFPNSFSGPDLKSAKVEATFPVSGDVARYNSADDDNFTQTGIFWRKVRVIYFVLLSFDILHILCNQESARTICRQIVGYLTECRDFFLFSFENVGERHRVTLISERGRF